MKYAYNIKLENGTTIKFNHIGTDKELDGELPPPVYSTEYFSIYKQEGVLNNGYIRCAILYNDGHINYCNVTLNENFKIVAGYPVSVSIDKSSYNIINKQGVIYIIPKENKILNLNEFNDKYGKVENLKELNDLLVNDEYSIKLRPTNPYRIFEKTII